MPRITALVLVALSALSALSALTVPSAGAAGAALTDPCTLVTRREAAKILGAKVVKVTRDTDAATGTRLCEYRTRVYVSPRFEKLKAPLKLKILLARLTDEIRAEIASSQSDLDPIADLGDEAYFTGVTSSDVLVLSGDYILETGPANWEGGPSKYQAMAEAAARKAVTRVPNG